MSINSRYLVSIVIPCYNQGEYLLETLDSVYKQTYSNYEIIIVNDGSTDYKTNCILEELSHPKVKVYTTKNRGLSSARNYAISRAKGQLILPLDSDDLLAPAFLTNCTAVLEKNPNISIVTTRVQLFGDKSKEFKFPKINAANMVIINCLVVTSLYYKTVWEEVGGYSNEMNTGWEDRDFWLSCIEKDLQFYKIEELLFFYRIKKDSMQASISRSTNRKKEIELLLRKRHPQLYIRKINPLRIFYLRFRYHLLKSSPMEILHYLQRLLKTIF